MQRCSDGICRVNCDYIKTLGCSMSHPILCAVGNCVKNIADCVESYCPSDRPILCAD
jgi:hypothetical protein